MVCQKVYKQGRDDAKVNNVLAKPHPYIFFTLLGVDSAPALKDAV